MDGISPKPIFLFSSRLGDPKDCVGCITSNQVVRTGMQACSRSAVGSYLKSACGRKEFPSGILVGLKTVPTCLETILGLVITHRQEPAAASGQQKAQPVI